jgi:hypothetical protein
MSRISFLVFLVGLVFFTHERAVGAEKVEVKVDVQRNVNPSEMIQITGTNSEGIRGSLATANLKRGSQSLGKFEISELRAGSVVLFAPWDQDPAQLIPWFREDIRFDLSGISSINVIIADEGVSVEYN